MADRTPCTIIVRTADADAFITACERIGHFQPEDRNDLPNGFTELHDYECVPDFPYGLPRDHPYHGAQNGHYTYNASIFAYHPDDGFAEADTCDGEHPYAAIGRDGKPNPKEANTAEDYWNIRNKMGF